MEYASKIDVLSRYLNYTYEIKTLEEVNVTYDVCIRIKTLKKHQTHIRESIYNVKNDKERNVLLRRYVLGDKIEYIAKQMKCSTRTVLRIHKSAVNNIVL